MNKQELIKAIKNLTRTTIQNHTGTHSHTTTDNLVSRNEILELVERMGSEPDRVKIPKFVADWLKENEPYICALNDLVCTSMPDNVYDWVWYRDNLLKLIYAHKNGYEVEPEQLYYIKLNKDNIGSYLNLVFETNRIFFGDIVNSECYKTRFTLDEIKQIDERYLPFAVKVEDDD